MPETGVTTYASFAATHEDRLVRSLVSESGLAPAAAAGVAADVLPAAHERSFDSCGSAFGWLRVAARHRAAGSPTWAEAADTALCQAAAARTALAGLPAEDRELLRLRYAEGLLPDALAARLGVPVADVLARLDRTAAFLATPAPAPVASAAPRRRRIAGAVTFPRLVAAAAAVTAVVLGGGVTPGATAPPLATGPLPPSLTLDGPVAVTAGTPVAASDLRADPAPARAADTRTERPAPPADQPPPDDADPSRPCVSGCRGRLFDRIRVPVPKQVGDATGQREIVIEQEHGTEYVHVCDVLAPVPAGVARCERAGH